MLIRHLDRTGVCYSHVDPCSARNELERNGLLVRHMSLRLRTSDSTTGKFNHCWIMTNVLVSGRVSSQYPLRFVLVQGSGYTHKTTNHQTISQSSRSLSLRRWLSLTKCLAICYLKCAELAEQTSIHSAQMCLHQVDPPLFGQGLRGGPERMNLT